MRSLVLLALAVVSASVGAQTIYKCRGHKGSVSYQTEPCGPDSKVAAVKSYAPIYDDPEAATRLRQTEADMQARSAQQRVATYGPQESSNTYGPRDQQRANCSAARAYRDSVLKRAGLNRTYNLLQQLDRSVNVACGGL